jgi:DNA-binding response OmpR family regulator
MTAAVLVVDDDDDVRALVRAVLQVDGFIAHAVGSGEAAIEWVRELGSPDAVVLDVQMPHRDGWETLATLRAMGMTCPVLMCTVKVRDATRAAEEGVGFLSKPFAVDDLRERVHGLLSRSGETGVKA